MTERYFILDSGEAKLDAAMALSRVQPRAEVTVWISRPSPRL